MRTSPDRTPWLLLTGFLLLAILAEGLDRAVSAAPGQLQDLVEMEVIPVQGSVYMLQTPTAGGNVGVLPGPEGVFLVDDQVPNLAESVIQGVRQLSDEEIRFVVNTHIHIDHIGGNERLAELGATIVAHESVLQRMMQELRIPRGGGRFRAQPPEAARPVVTFNDAMSFRMNGEEVRVFLVPPAHTDGDAFVHFVDSDVLHTGDVFRTNMYPIIDVFNGGTVAGMIHALEIAIDLAGPDTKVIPGHGFGFTDRDGLIEVHTMLTDLRGSVREMIAQGMHLEEVMAARPTAEYDERWGQVPSWTALDLVPIIYNEAGGGPSTVITN